MVEMARENSGWGYDRIVGALARLGSPEIDARKNPGFWVRGPSFPFSGSNLQIGDSNLWLPNCIGLGRGAL